MSVDEAAQAAGTQLVALDGNIPYTKESCSYAKLPNGPEGLEFMLHYNQIVRVDLRSHVVEQVDGHPVQVDLTPEISQITTQNGARIGDTEERIKALYSGQVEVAEHKYVPGGHYLIVTPKESDSNARIIFETEGDRVTYIRAGQLPEVNLVERCG
jgi:hypothetical protein